MVKLSRYFLVLVAIIVFCYSNPKLYWMAFAEPIRVPFVMYSCIENDFLIQYSDNEIKWKDTKGNQYTREEYEERLPLLYTRQLLISGTMYDTINGVAMDMHEINANRSTFRSRPKDLFTPEPGLYPLFESESGRANLEMPKDFFRITWRMEFIDAESNQVLEDKSQMFSAVLYNRGFLFPAKKISGLPTIRKSCDEGYLVTDSKDQLFHIKMVEGKPYVKKIDLPEGLVFKYIHCVDLKNKRYYAYLFSDKNELYILTQDDYLLKKLPVDGLLPEKEEVRIYGDLFNFNIINTGDGYIRSQVLDYDFNKVDEYKETWLVPEERIEGKIAQALFPAQISMSNKNSSFVNFYLKFTRSISWVILSLFLIAIQFMVIRKRDEQLKNHILDICLGSCSWYFWVYSSKYSPKQIL